MITRVQWFSSAGGIFQKKWVQNQEGSLMKSSKPGATEPLYFSILTEHLLFLRAFACIISGDPLSNCTGRYITHFLIKKETEAQRN